MLNAFNATKIVNIYHFKAIFSAATLIIMFFYEFSGAIEPIASIRQCSREGKGTGEMGERYWQTGKKVLCNEIRPPALINQGERPYILERTG